MFSVVRERERAYAASETRAKRIDHVFSIFLFLILFLSLFLHASLPLISFFSPSLSITPSPRFSPFFSQEVWLMPCVEVQCKSLLPLAAQLGTAIFTICQYGDSLASPLTLFSSVNSFSIPKLAMPYYCLYYCCCNTR